MTDGWIDKNEESLFVDVVEVKEVESNVGTTDDWKLGIFELENIVEYGVGFDVLTVGDKLCIEFSLGIRDVEIVG